MWQSDGAVSIAELFEEYEESLRRYAMSLVHNRDWADDLVQETFIRAWSHLPLLGVLSPPQRRAWLRRVLNPCPCAPEQLHRPVPAERAGACPDRRAITMRSPRWTDGTALNVEGRLTVPEPLSPGSVDAKDPLA